MAALVFALVIVAQPAQAETEIEACEAISGEVEAGYEVQAVEPQATGFATVSGQADYTKAYEILRLVNGYRKSAGKSELLMDEAMLNTAMQRAAEAAVLYSHTRPNGTAYSTAFPYEGYVGENLAHGNGTAKDAVDLWMRGSSSSSAILEGSFKTIGIGCFTHNGVTFWTQCFSSKSISSGYNTSGTSNQTYNTTLRNGVFEDVTADKSKPVQYMFQPKLKMDKTYSPGVSNSTNLSIICANPGFSGFDSVLGGAQWSSSNTNNLTVNNYGTITVGKNSGWAKVTAKLCDFTLAADVQVSTPQPMYRLYNPNSGEHFYTASASERDQIAAAGWKYEGIGWNAPASSGQPVYRLYSGTDHHYCTDPKEKSGLQAAGWSYEGIGWYSDTGKTVPLYRQFNPNVDPSAARNNSGSHNYTTSLSENNALVSAGWKAEGIGWYGTSAGNKISSIAL